MKISLQKQVMLHAKRSLAILLALISQILPFGHLYTHNRTHSPRLRSLSKEEKYYRMKKFAIAKVATPFLETPDFNSVFGGDDGNSLPLDDQNLLRLVSGVAFPQTKFELLQQHSDYIFQAWSKNHQLEKLFIDIRFLEEVSEKYPERAKVLPSRDAILENLYKLLGTSYIWGGNWHSGIPEMRVYYPPKIAFEQLDPIIQKTWVLQGVDCSGLLYQVTNGITPRATSLMMNFGEPVSIQNKSHVEIFKKLQPLDLILFHGHVLIVFDQHSVIESRGKRGVILSSIEECFDHFLKDKEPIDVWNPLKVEKKYCVRRWVL